MILYRYDKAVKGGKGGESWVEEIRKEKGERGGGGGREGGKGVNRTEGEEYGRSSVGYVIQTYSIPARPFIRSFVRSFVRWFFFKKKWGGGGGEFGFDPLVFSSQHSIRCDGKGYNRREEMTSNRFSHLFVLLSSLSPSLPPPLISTIFPRPLPLQLHFSNTKHPGEVQGDMYVAFGSTRFDFLCCDALNPRR